MQNFTATQIITILSNLSQQQNCEIAEILGPCQMSIDFLQILQTLQSDFKPYFPIENL